MTCIKMFHGIKRLCFLLFLFISICAHSQILLPINVANRKDVSSFQLTKIGQFGLMRKARNTIPEHYHTGIDIKRPGKNYTSEPVFPIAAGKVISKRTDGPFANIIVEHIINGRKIWSLYEHVAGIEVNVNDAVLPQKPIARFMNTEELNRFGWQFDHFHLEIIKVKPFEIKPGKNHPQRYYNAYTLVCYTPDDLNRYYFNPIAFFNSDGKQ